MIRAVASLDFLMSSIAAFMRPIASTPRSALCLVCAASELARVALAAFWRVIAAISSIDELVSSMAAAWRLAPSASETLADETWPAALAVCCEPAVRPPMIRRSGPTIERVIISAAKMPRPMHTSRPTVSVNDEAVRLAEAWSATLRAPSTPAWAVSWASASTCMPTSVRFAPTSCRLCQLVRKLFIVAR